VTRNKSRLSSKELFLGLPGLFLPLGQKSKPKGMTVQGVVIVCVFTKIVEQGLYKSSGGVYYCLRGCFEYESGHSS
jgi:hypothetical protein